MKLTENQKLNYLNLFQMFPQTSGESLTLYPFTYTNKKTLKTIKSKTIKANDKYDNKS